MHCLITSQEVTVTLTEMSLHCAEAVRRTVHYSIKLTQVQMCDYVRISMDRQDMS